ncbi:hypothetical protein F4780DRAFT_711336 [Xylariomycetidae sp. FL0641]|nr:hypothetical protein F4780DRAFT_711336 [Xylariomycetidae sp. FL0641]
MPSAKMPEESRRHWLLTSPRTASNLFVRILNLDAQGVRPAKHGGYFFMPAMPTRLTLMAKPMNEWTAEEKANLDKVQQECFDRLQDHLKDADEQGESIFVKEHIFFTCDPHYQMEYEFGPETVGPAPAPLKMRGVERGTRSQHNLTSMPDEFLKLWHPTILIRHPAMMMPSLFRTTLSDIEVDGAKRPRKEPCRCEATNKWLRAMYQFYMEHQQELFGDGDGQPWASHPIILDADDIMTKPELVRKYAAAVGFDPEKLTYEWQPATPEQIAGMNPAEKRMLSSINASSTIDPSKVAGAIDIDVEAQKWRDEFGDEGGRKLERWVRDAMPDYEYLRSQRMTV